MAKSTFFSFPERNIALVVLLCGGVAVGGQAAADSATVEEAQPAVVKALADRESANPAAGDSELLNADEKDEEKSSPLALLLPKYGNWCGPNHPVNIDSAEDPIDKLDAACRRHDMCYAANGYLACECDATFREEVEAGLLNDAFEGNERHFARTFRAYFHGSPCNGDAGDKFAPSRAIHNVVNKAAETGKRVVDKIPRVGGDK